VRLEDFVPLFFPYLPFDGTCREALRFYERLFQGRIEVLTTVGESPMASQSLPVARTESFMAAWSSMVARSWPRIGWQPIPTPAFEACASC
jgi:hypothetical protein